MHKPKIIYSCIQMFMYMINLFVYTYIDGDHIKYLHFSLFIHIKMYIDKTAESYMYKRWRLFGALAILHIYTENFLLYIYNSLNTYICCKYINFLLYIEWGDKSEFTGARVNEPQ